MKTGIELIAIERQEQIEKHGRSVERDVSENRHEQLVHGAIKLLGVGKFSRPLNWDENLWNKMERKSNKERLIIAGALIAAELDRLQANNK